MKILDDLISTIEPHPIKQVIIGVFDTMVISKNCGLATTLREKCGRNGYKKVRNLGNLEDMDVKELDEYAKSDDLLEASVGMAAINAGINLPKKEFTQANGKNIFLNKGRGKNAAIIGHFPFLSKMKDEFKNLYIFELEPLPGDLTDDKMPEILPCVDVLALTATTLTNHTFDEVMKFCSKNTYVIMLGPTTPLSTILFDYGIDAVCGAYIKNAELTLKYLRQGAIFKMLKGVEYITLLKRMPNSNF